jgi:hypothetical protein
VPQEDELAQETKRTTLLDRVEEQLKGKQHISRAVVALAINEEKRTPSAIDREFKTWLTQQEKEGEDLSGVMVFVTNAALQLLEGPTEMIFKALQFLHTLCQSDSGQDEDPGSPVSPASATAALVTNLRILHFTELHGVRTSRSWCSVANPSKPQGGNQAQMDDSNSAEFVYAAYNKLLVLCLKATEQCGEDASSQDALAAYKKVPELMPTVEEVSAFLAKGNFESFFTYPEFEKVFVAPFNLVLTSEILWPMPPRLSY